MKDKVIGGCRIIRKIGEGGMGIVFEAEQVSLGRQVALKLLPIKFHKDEDYEKRFVREARSAARINHTNVVQIYNAGRDGDHLYLVMEFVDGVTLQEKIMQSPFLPQEEMADIIKSIAQAIFQAEKRKIVHRDLKPANIMITSAGIVKVMDFGLAKQTDTMTHLTAAGKLLGTPFYMSPEQINGEEVDSRSDLYSTGIILYFMMTKDKPFKGDLFTVIQHQLHSPRPDPKLINPQSPEFLRRLYFKMTKKDRKERLQSFKDVINSIEKFSADRAPLQQKVLEKEEGTQMVSREQALKKKPEPYISPAKPKSSALKIPLIAGGIIMLTLIVLLSWKVITSTPALQDKKTVVEKQAEEFHGSQPETGREKPEIQEKEELSLPSISRVKGTGARLLSADFDEGTVTYREICSVCNEDQGKNRTVILPMAASSKLQTFLCKKCSKKNLVIIENQNIR